MKKIIFFFLGLCIVLLYSPPSSTEAAPLNCADYLKTKKVWWDGVELVPGQIGRLKVLEDTPLYKLEGTKKIFSRTLKKGELYRIYAFKPGMLNVGGGFYVDRDSKVNYATPSSAKLNAIACIKSLPSDITRGFNKIYTYDSILQRESALLLNANAKYKTFIQYRTFLYGKEVKLNYHIDSGSLWSMEYEFPIVHNEFVVTKIEKDYLSLLQTKLGPPTDTYDGYTVWEREGYQIKFYIDVEKTGQLNYFNKIQPRLTITFK